VLTSNVSTIPSTTTYSDSSSLLLSEYLLNKQPEREAFYASPPSPEVENEWSLICTPPIRLHSAYKKSLPLNISTSRGRNGVLRSTILLEKLIVARQVKIFFHVS
jgi:hypothetical protein